MSVIVKSSGGGGKGNFIINGETVKEPKSFISEVLLTNETSDDLSDLPFNVVKSFVVLYRDEVHILGGTYASTSHYKLSGGSWSSVSDLPYNITDGQVVILNDEIHILGGTGGYKNHYKWNGSTWASVST